MEHTPGNIKHKVNTALLSAAGIFTIGVIFNAGIEYDRISHIEVHQSTQDVQIASLQTQLQMQLQPINTQLAKQSQMLEDIKTELSQGK